MPIHVSPFVRAVVGLSIGGAVIVLAISWVRSRALASVDEVSGANKLSEWPYTIALWGMTVLLGVVFYRIGPMSLTFSLALAGACTFGVLGLIWPRWMHDSKLSPVQRFVQRVVFLVVSGILIAIAADHFG
jgi:hypothetical protein